MAKALTCDCGWEGQAETMDALMAKTKAHVESVHPEMELTPEVLEQTKAKVRDV